MTREIFVEKLKTDKLDGDDLLHLAYTMSNTDVGKILLEFYYALVEHRELVLDVVENLEISWNLNEEET